MAISVPVVIYAILSLTIVRMLPVAISLRGTGLQRPTVAFIGWFGPRGLASIVLTLVALGDGGGTPPFGATVVWAVAVTIALSVLAHGYQRVPPWLVTGRSSRPCRRTPRNTSIRPSCEPAAVWTVGPLPGRRLAEKTRRTNMVPAVGGRRGIVRDVIAPWHIAGVNPITGLYAR